MLLAPGHVAHNLEASRARVYRGFHGFRDLLRHGAVLVALLILLLNED